jgi:hypothetical protein
VDGIGVSSVAWPRLRKGIPETLFLLLTTAAGLAAGGRWLIPLGDVGLWWSLLSRLDGGQRLYRDVFLQYGPLSPYLLAAGSRLFGLTSAYVLLVNWIAAILCGLLLLRLARRCLFSEMEVLAVAVLLLALSIFAPGLSPLVLPYAPAAVHGLAFSVGALLLLGGSGGMPFARALGAGALAGLAFCAKQEIGAAALLGLLASLALDRQIRPVGAALAGFGAVAGAGLLVVIASASDSVLWRLNHVWPLAFETPASWRRLFRTMLGISGPNWAVVVRASVWSLLCVLCVAGAVGLVVGRERRPRGWLPVGLLAAALVGWWGIEGYLLTDRFFPASLSLLVSLGVVAFGLADRRLPARSLIVGVSLFATLNAARTAFAPDLYGPYSKTAQFCASLTWVLFLGTVVPRILARAEAPRAVIRTLLVVACLAVSSRGAWNGAASLSRPDLAPLETPRGVVYLDPFHRPFFEAIRSGVRPGESALILPEANAVDVLLGLRDVSPYLLHLPGWLDEDGERALLRRLEKDVPDVVIVFQQSTWLYGVGPFGKGYGRELASWISARYRPVQRLPAGMILRRAGSKGAAPAPL